MDRTRALMAKKMANERSRLYAVQRVLKRDWDIDFQHSLDFERFGINDFLCEQSDAT
jgi:hypothetical protein